MRLHTRRRAGFMLAAMFMTAAALMGMTGSYFFIAQREEARDLNTAQAMRDLVALASATNAHYLYFMETVNEELEYYKEHGAVQGGAKENIIGAWDTTGLYEIAERVDTIETSAEYMARLGIEGIQDPAEGKFIESCSVTSRVIEMMKDKVDLDAFPFDYVPGLWMVRINLRCVPGYFFSTEALNRASAMLRTFGEANVSGDFENINFSVTKINPDEIELTFMFNQQSRDISYY